MKRIVTGHDRSGKSVFVSEEEPPKQVSHGASGLQITEIWRTDGVPVVPAPSGDPTTVRHQYFPAPGGTLFVAVRFPPTAEAERRPRAASTCDLEVGEAGMESSWKCWKRPAARVAR
jgi:hypothetical protein